MMSAAYGCRVLGFEPQPLLVKLANLSSNLNGFENRVDIRNNIVGSVSGKDYSISLDFGYATVSRDNKLDENKKYTVSKSIRLDDVIKEDVLLLKIDIEGYEDELFKGISDSFYRKYKIRNILVEMKKLYDWQYKLSWLNQRIREGYHAFVFWPMYNTKLLPTDNWEIKSINNMINHRNISDEWIENNWEDIWLTLDTVDIGN